MLKTQLKEVTSQGKGFKCGFDRGEALLVERVLCGARRPNTAGLGLEKAGVKLGPHGGVEVDARLQSSTAAVYAIGDVIGGRMLSSEASFMGLYAAQNALGAGRDFPFHLTPPGHMDPAPDGGGGAQRGPGRGAGP